MKHFSQHMKFTLEVEGTIRYYLTQEQWFPDQIKHYCAHKDIPMVSVERIYEFIRQDKAKGGVCTNIYVINSNIVNEL